MNDAIEISANFNNIDSYVYNQLKFWSYNSLISKKTFFSSVGEIQLNFQLQTVSLVLRKYFGFLSHLVIRYLSLFSHSQVSWKKSLHFCLSLKYALTQVDLTFLQLPHTSKELRVNPEWVSEWMHGLFFTLGIQIH